MNPSFKPVRPGLSHLIAVRPDPQGRYTAQVVGLPEVRTVADTEEEALKQARDKLAEWLATIRLFEVHVSPSHGVDPASEYAGHAKDDPLFDEYLEEIARFRKEADEQEWSNTSSIPTT
jgi:predicted RNase H-like HicB family nuclease